MPLHAWTIRGRHTRSKYRQLKKSEFAKPSDLRAIQDDRLRKLVEHAYQTSAFYRKRFEDLGLTPSDIHGVHDLDRLPLLSKNDVRENINSTLLSTAFQRSELLKITTSGSTGEPFTIFANRDQLEVRFAATLRALESTGWRFGQPQVRLWHQTLGMSRTQVVRERLDALLLNRRFIPAFEFSPKTIDEFVRRIESKKPVLIDGYAESLNFLASYLAAGNPIDLSPIAVMSSAQMLPRSTKETIEKSLKTKVFDKYGSREFSGIAYECLADNGHHVVDECYFVELLVDGRPARPGEVGEIVVTDLYNFATPMIRYRIGDLAVALDNSTPCPCGRGHSRIGEIQGRTQAIVHCANGTWMPGTFFAHFFKDYESVIRFFQIEQNRKGEFALRIVRGSHFSHESLHRILADLRQHVGDTRIDIKLVDSIPLVRTGKRSPVISHMGVDFQDLPHDSIRRSD